ncbi:hypothetical protein [Deinococcus budaensis]|uniref:hypothetical protein n=1 Tax=Deinococcus budaensis TaxID=1665626 RepID=UPI0035F23B46
MLHPDDVGKPRVLHQLTPGVAARGHRDSAARTSRAAEPEHSNAQGFPVAQSFRSASRRDGVVKRGRMGHLVAHAQAAGARIVMSRHKHIPMVTLDQGVWVINPGALASGTAFTAQSLCTVARMRLALGVPPEVTHWGLGKTPQPVGVSLDWSAGFAASCAASCVLTWSVSKRLFVRSFRLMCLMPSNSMRRTSGRLTACRWVKFRRFHGTC